VRRRTAGRYKLVAASASEREREFVGAIRVGAYLLNGSYPPYNTAATGEERLLYKNIAAPNNEISK